MAAKIFLAKLILGSDIHKDLALAEKEVQEAQDKYNSACQVISVLEERGRTLNKSKQEISFSQSEKLSIDNLHAMHTQPKV